MKRLLLSAATVLFLTACSSGADLAAAKKAVDQFHAELNAGQFGRIQAESSPEWKQASSPADTIQLFTGVRKKLGNFVSGQEGDWRVNFGTGGTIIMLQYKSKFQKSDAVETFTYRRSGDGVQLVGYNINSRALITG
ncbi:MAG TPA: hypothetical protein VF067_00180 [Sphingomicrobium sp.]